MREMDGGPAFPGPESNGDDHEGMSLRDYFAAQALQNMLPWDFTANVESMPKYVLMISKTAYSVADAMLKAREE